MESEELLENVLVKNPGLLLDNLTLVGRQTPTEGGPLDLLGVDEDGRLCVFELKRDTLRREAVAQIIDYASDLDFKNDLELANHIVTMSGTGGIEQIDNFEEWYLGNTEAESLASLRPMRLFLGGLGIDDRAERMVRFLAENSDMEISLLTFQGFVQDGEMFLAKQVEVEPSQAKGGQSSRSYLSASEKFSLLENHVAEFGVRDLFDGIRSTFRENWPEYNEVVNPSSIGFRMPAYVDSRRKQRAFGRIYPGNGKVGVVFYQTAANLSRAKFRPLTEQMGCETIPNHLDPISDFSTAIQLLFDLELWEAHKEALVELLRALYSAWQERSQASAHSDISEGTTNQT